MRVVRPRVVFAAAFLVSVATVVAAIPGRWEGKRTATDAYIPLRPMSAAEAAALLSLAESGAALLKLDDSSVLLGTNCYLVPLAAPEDKGHAEGSVISHQGRRWAMYSASWESYYNIHWIDRARLESALGRVLSQADVSGDAFADERISFASDRLWVYVASEITFLTLLFGAAALGLQRIRSLLLLPPLFLLLAVALWLFVSFYSPAFVDADWFHQRVVVEQLALLDFSASFSVVNPLAMVASCLVLYGLQRLARSSRLPVSSRAFWAAVFAATATAIVSMAGFAYAHYRRERGSAIERLSEVAAGLDRGTVHWLARAANERTPAHPSRPDLYSSGSPDDRFIRALDQVLDRARLDPGQQVRVLVALEGDRFLFLWRNPSFRYADVRRLKHDGSEIIDYEEIRRMLDSRADLSRGFWSHLRRPHLSGRFLDLRDAGTAVMIVDACDGSPAPLLRRVVSAFLP